MLTTWALDGHGIVMKPYFDVAEHLRAGELVPCLPNIKPTDVQLGCLYPHRRKQDPKSRLFIEFMASQSRSVFEPKPISFNCPDTSNTQMGIAIGGRGNGLLRSSRNGWGRCSRKRGVSRGCACGVQIGAGVEHQFVFAHREFIGGQDVAVRCGHRHW